MKNKQRDMKEKRSLPNIKTQKLQKDINSEKKDQLIKQLNINAYVKSKAYDFNVIKTQNLKQYNDSYGFTTFKELFGEKKPQPKIQVQVTKLSNEDSYITKNEISAIQNESKIQDSETNKTQENNNYINDINFEFKKSAIDLFQSCLYWNQNQVQKQQKIDNAMNKTLFSGIQNINGQFKQIKELKKKTKIQQILQEKKKKDSLQERPNNKKEKEKQKVLDNVQIYSFNVEILIGPQTLTDATLTNVENKLYLIGGQSSLQNQNIFELDLEVWKWNVVKNKIQNKCGHKAVKFENQIYIFGGQSKKNQQKRECLNDLQIFNTKTYQLNQINQDDPPQPRRFYASAIVGYKYLVIYGGINDKGIYHNDINFYNLDTMQWEKQQVDNDIDGNQGIAHNVFSYVQTDENKLQNLVLDQQDERPYQTNQLVIKQQNKIKEQGLYSFGGKKTSGQSSNTLKLLKFNQNSLKWKGIDLKGKPPQKRWGHTMNFMEKISCLIIHGGFTEISQSPLNDLYLINLQYMQWVEIEFYGTPLKQRFKHCSDVVNGCLIIFGGQDIDHYHDSKLQILDFDDIKIKQRSNGQTPDNAPIVNYEKKNPSQIINKQKIESENHIDMKDETIQDIKQIQPSLSYLPVPKAQFLKKQSEFDFKK